MPTFATTLKLTDDEFYERFAVIPGPEGSDMYEHADTLGFHRQQVWSVLDVDGELYAIPGYAVINVIGYNVTAHPWPHDNIEVRFDSVDRL